MTEIGRTGLVNLIGEVAGGKGLEGLRVGDVITAFVLEKSEGDEILLSLKGARIPARTEAALAVGDRISLKVEEVSGAVVLKLIGREVSVTQRVGDLMRNMAPQSMSVGSQYSELISVAGAILRQMPVLKDGAIGVFLAKMEQVWLTDKASGGELRAFTEDSGIFYEQRLASQMNHGEKVTAFPSDLKALVLDVQREARELRDQNPGLRADFDKLLEISDRVLKNTEIVQLANSMTGRTDGASWTVFPYGDKNQADSVDWEVRQRNDDKGSEGLSFSLTFNLRGLGAVKVDGLLADDRLNCYFWGEDEESTRFIDAHLAEFSRSAEANGVTTGSLACSVSRESGGGHLQRITSATGMRLVDRRA